MINRFSEDWFEQKLGLFCGGGPGGGGGGEGGGMSASGGPPQSGSGSGGNSLGGSAGDFEGTNFGGDKANAGGGLGGGSGFGGSNDYDNDGIPNGIDATPGMSSQGAMDTAVSAAIGAAIGGFGGGDTSVGGVGPADADSDGVPDSIDADGGTGQGTGVDMGTGIGPTTVTAEDDIGISAAQEAAASRGIGVGPDSTGTGTSDRNTTVDPSAMGIGQDPFSPTNVTQDVGLTPDITITKAFGKVADISKNLADLDADGEVSVVEGLLTAVVPGLSLARGAESALTANKYDTNFGSQQTNMLADQDRGFGPDEGDIGDGDGGINVDIFQPTPAAIDPTTGEYIGMNIINPYLYGQPNLLQPNYTPVPEIQTPVLQPGYAARGPYGPTFGQGSRGLGSLRTS